MAGGEGWAPSDGHGHDRGGYGRPGRDIELVAREDGQRASIRLLQKRTLSLPTPPHALPPPVLPPAPPPRGAPTSLPSRALSPLPGEPRETESSERERERERMRKSWLRGVAGWLARRGCSLVTRPGNVTRSFIRSAPLACTPGSRGR